MDLKTISPAIADSSFLEFDFGGAGRRPRAVLSTLAAGTMKYSHSETNSSRDLFFRSLGLDEKRVLALELKHTRRVVAVRGPEEAKALGPTAEGIGGADGILCADPSYVPVLTVADCMPIWLFDAGHGVFGLLHSGWKGTGILVEALRSMEKGFESKPADISAILGPSIGSCCYAVPEERALQFEREFGEKAVIVRGEGGDKKFHLDLRAANLGIALRLGIGRLLNVDLCTACSGSLGSYRRQGPKDFTRMAALCGYFQ